MPESRSNILKKWVTNSCDFLLFSNIFIGVCAIAQALLTYKVLNIPIDNAVLAILLCSTVGIYNFSMLIQKPGAPENSDHRRVRWIFGHYRLMVSISIIAIISLIPLAFFMSVTSLILLAFLAIISIAYNLPLFALNGRKFGLRNIPGLKLFLIALVWSLSSVLYPVVQSGESIIVEKTVELLGFNFLFITAITIPFDIRDLFQDRHYHMKTLPVLLGERGSRKACHICLTGCWMLLILFCNGSMSPVFAGLGISLLLTHVMVQRSTTRRSELYYFLILDGLMIIQLLLVCGSNWIWGIF